MRWWTRGAGFTGRRLLPSGMGRSTEGKEKVCDRCVLGGKLCWLDSVAGRP